MNTAAKQEATDKIATGKAADTLRVSARVANLLADDRMDRPVPTVRTEEIKDHKGKTLREPMVEKVTWRDPNDTTPNRREAKEVEGYRVAEALVTLKKRGGQITDLHIRAGRKLLSDYELGEVGARPGWERPEIGGGFGSSDGPTVERLNAMRKYREAKGAVPTSQWPIIWHVVIQNGSARQYAVERRMRKDQAVGYLIAALDCLVDHYDLRNEEKRRKAKSEKAAA